MRKIKFKSIDNDSQVVVKSVSCGTPDEYVGKSGTVTDITRNVYSVLFNDGKTQHFFKDQLDEEGAVNE